MTVLTGDQEPVLEGAAESSASHKLAQVSWGVGVENSAPNASTGCSCYCPLMAFGVFGNPVRVTL